MKAVRESAATRRHSHVHDSTRMDGQMASLPGRHLLHPRLHHLTIAAAAWFRLCRPNCRTMYRHYAIDFCNHP